MDEALDLQLLLNMTSDSAALKRSIFQYRILPSAATLSRGRCFLNETDSCRCCVGGKNKTSPSSALITAIQTAVNELHKYVTTEWKCGDPQTYGLAYAFAATGYDIRTFLPLSFLNLQGFRTRPDITAQKCRNRGFIFLH